METFAANDNQALINLLLGGFTGVRYLHAIVQPTARKQCVVKIPV